MFKWSVFGAEWKIMDILNPNVLYQVKCTQTTHYIINYVHKQHLTIVAHLKIKINNYISTTKTVLFSTMLKVAQLGNSSIKLVPKVPTWNYELRGAHVQLPNWQVVFIIIPTAHAGSIYPTFFFLYHRLLYFRVCFLLCLAVYQVL